MRAHIYQVITDDAGNVQANTAVRILQAGSDTGSPQVFGGTVWATKDGAQTMTSPFTVANGIVDVWLDEPQFVMLGLTAPGTAEYFIDNVSAWEPPVVPTVVTDDGTDLVIPGANSGGNRDGQALLWDGASAQPKWGSVATGGGGTAPAGGGGPLGMVTMQVLTWGIDVPNGHLQPASIGNFKNPLPVGVAPSVADGGYTVAINDPGWYTCRIRLDMGWTDNVGPDSIDMQGSPDYFGVIPLGMSIPQVEPNVAGSNVGGNSRAVKGCTVDYLIRPFYVSADGAAAPFSFDFWWKPGAGTPCDPNGYNEPLCWMELVRLS